MHFDNLNKPYSIAPPPYTLDSNKDYYVYEWYIKETSEIFYIGKGKNQRYKSTSKRNNDFKKILDNFDVDVRKVKENLTEYDAFIFEEDYIYSMLCNGKNLLNIDVIGINYVDEPLFDLNSCGLNPTIYKQFTLEKLVNRDKAVIISDFVDYAFKGIINHEYDTVSLSNLENINFISKEISPFPSFYTYLLNIYSKYTDKKFNVASDYIDHYKNRVIDFTNNARENKVNFNKHNGCIISCTYLTFDEYLQYKKNKIEVYHLSDVIEFINNIK